MILAPLWDGAPDRRTGLITSQTPPRDRERVCNFFREVNILDAVVAEAKRGWAGWCHRPGEEAPYTSDTPSVIISRFRDNVYIAVISVNPDAVWRIREGVMVLLEILYGVPLKWEPHTEGVTWGEAYVNTGTRGLALGRKGAAISLDSSPEVAEVKEWERWVSVESANARFTINS